MSATMHAMNKLAIGAFAALALACSRDAKPHTAALSDALQGDLQRASAPTSDLASSQYTSRQVVSAIELGEMPQPAAALNTPKKHVATRAKPSPKPQVQQVAAVAPEPAPDPTVMAPVPEPGPIGGPRPTPNPVIYPAGTGQSSAGTNTHASRGGIGSIIGVILRGGVVDGDHCDPRGRGRTSMPVSIDLPMPMPVHGAPIGTRVPHAGW